MIEFPKQKVVYCNVPRTGSNRIRTIFEHHYRRGGIIVETDFHCPWHGTAWYPRFKNYTVVVSVRHPYRRVVSLWSFFNTVANEHDNPGSAEDAFLRKCAKNLRKETHHIRERALPTVSDFLDTIEVPDTWYVKTCYDVLLKKPDIVIRLERLKEDMRPLLEVGPSAHTPINRSAAANNWQDHITQRDADKIKELFRFEFEEFDYSYDLNAVKQGKYFI